MKYVIKGFKKHPLAILFYLTNIVFWFGVFQVNKSSDAVFLGLAALFTALFFLIVSIFCLAFTKDKFYAWLIVFIAIPLSILLVFEW